jgi:hypothetical protein
MSYAMARCQHRYLEGFEAMHLAFNEELAGIQVAGVKYAVTGCTDFDLLKSVVLHSPVAQGASCQFEVDESGTVDPTDYCGPGLMCDAVGTGVGTCVPATATMGQPCVTRCALGFLCENSENRPDLVPATTIGSVCIADDRVQGSSCSQRDGCPNGMPCVFSVENLSDAGVCGGVVPSSRLALGAACTTSGPNCGHGLACRPLQGTPNMVCSQLAAAGASCADDEDCASENCGTDGRCSAEYCTESSAWRDESASGP